MKKSKIIIGLGFATMFMAGQAQADQCPFGACHVTKDLKGSFHANPYVGESPAINSYNNSNDPNNVSINNDELRVSLTYQGNTDKPLSFATGRIDTAPIKLPEEGYLEFTFTSQCTANSIGATLCQGFWPGLWMVGGSWPKNGEEDFLEALIDSSNNTSHSTTFIMANSAGGAVTHRYNDVIKQPILDGNSHTLGSYWQCQNDFATCRFKTYIDGKLVNDIGINSPDRPNNLSDLQHSIQQGFLNGQVLAISLHMGEQNNHADLAAWSKQPKGTTVGYLAVQSIKLYQKDTGITISDNTAKWDGQSSEIVTWHVVANTTPLPDQIQSTLSLQKSHASVAADCRSSMQVAGQWNCTARLSAPVVVADKTYHYTISASDDAADKATATGSFTTSNQPTTCHVPTDVKGIYNADGTVSLSWKGPQEATYTLEDWHATPQPITGYEKLTTTSARPHVGSPGPDNTYLFHVVSVCDWLGKTSAPTPITVTATPTPPKTCPAPIVDGRGGTYNGGQVTLNWTAPDLSNVDHYQLQDWQHGGLADSDYATIKTTSGPRPVGDPDWTNKDYIFYIVSVCKDGNTSKPALFDVLWHK